MGNGKPFSKYFEYVVIFVVVATIFVFIVFQLLGYDVSNNLLKIKDIFISVILVTVTFIFLITIFMLSKWVTSKSGLVIQPFEVSKSCENYNGRAISYLIIQELLRIEKINNFYDEFRREHEEVHLERTYGLESVSLPEANQINSEIANLGTAGLGSISVSLGQLLIVLKRLIRPSRMITGSLERYGSFMTLVAWGNLDKSGELGKPISWESTRSIKHQEKDEEKIKGLIRDLAFMISKDDVQTNAKTWEGHKFFTEAMNEYYLYKKTKFIKWLDDAGENCINAMEKELIYKDPEILLYAIGIEYLNLEKRGCIQKAEILFNKALKSRPDNVTFLMGRAAALDELGVDEDTRIYDKEAKDIYNRLILLKPEKLYLIYNNRGSVLRDLGEYDEAKKSLVKSIELKPDFPMAYYNKGFVHYELYEFEEAKKCLNEAIKLDKEFREAWDIKGLIEVTDNNYDKALKCFENAINLDKEDSLAWACQGKIFLDKNKCDKALKCFENAIILVKEKENWNMTVSAKRSMGRNPKIIFLLSIRMILMKMNYG